MLYIFPFTSQPNLILLSLVIELYIEHTSTLPLHETQLITLIVYKFTTPFDLKRYPSSILNVVLLAATKLYTRMFNFWVINIYGHIVWFYYMGEHLVLLRHFFISYKFPLRFMSFKTYLPSTNQGCLEISVITSPMIIITTTPLVNTAHSNCLRYP